MNNKKKRILYWKGVTRVLGSWYLFKVKFMKDSNFFVREVWRGRGVLERSLEIAEVLRGGGRR